MQIRKAERKKAKLRLGISAPSGAGKTYSSLLIAYGITGDWSKIVLIDTENGSGDLYADLGDYLVLPLEAPFTPERYVQAIKLAEREGECIIIDSLSHAWAGSGGALELVDTMMAGQKNKFTAWREVTPMHNSLVEAMLQSKSHIIATMRAKTEYILEEDDKGRKVPKKIGLAPIQRDGMEYEFTVMLDLSIQHVATATKDRTRIFDGQYFKPSIETGAKLLEWLETGVEMMKPDTEHSIREKWATLGFKESALDQQCQKTYGCKLSALTEANAQDFCAKLDGLLQTKLNETSDQKGA